MRTEEAGISTLKKEKVIQDKKKSNKDRSNTKNRGKQKKKLTGKFNCQSERSLVFEKYVYGFKRPHCTKKVYRNYSMKEEKYLGKDMCKTTSFRKPDMK